MADVSVPVDTYEELLGRSLDEIDAGTVPVDARGFSPMVAEVYGRDYMDNRILLFDEDQFDLDVQREEYSFMAELMQDIDRYRVFDLDDFPGPVSGEVNIYPNVALDYYAIHAEPDWEHLPEEVQEIEQAREGVLAVEGDDVKDPAHTRKLVEQVEKTGMTAEELRSTWVGQHLGGIIRESFTYETEDTAGFYTHIDEEPVAITIGEPDVSMENDLYWLDMRAVWEEEPVGTIVQELYDSGMIELSLHGLMQDQGEISGRYLDRIKRRRRRNEGDHAIIQDLLQLEDDLDEDWFVLEELREERDFGIDTGRDRQKLDYLRGEDDFSRRLADRLREVELEEITAYRGTDSLITGLEDAFDEWRGRARRTSYRDAERILEDLPYGADQVESFCERQDLCGKDGQFVSAAVNHMEDDSVTLPDMTGVDYIGAANDGKEIVIEGGVGTYAAKYMEDGRLEVKGPVDSDESHDWVGEHMEGGEVYLHENGEVDPYHEGGSIYRKQSLILGKSRWQEVR